LDRLTPCQLETLFYLRYAKYVAFKKQTTHKEDFVQVNHPLNQLNIRVGKNASQLILKLTVAF
jgi:hypothetical protein